MGADDLKLKPASEIAVSPDAASASTWETSIGSIDGVDPAKWADSDKVVDAFSSDIFKSTAFATPVEGEGADVTVKSVIADDLKEYLKAAKEEERAGKAKEYLDQLRDHPDDFKLKSVVVNEDNFKAAFQKVRDTFPKAPVVPAGGDGHVDGAAKVDAKKGDEERPVVPPPPAPTPGVVADMGAQAKAAGVLGRLINGGDAEAKLVGGLLKAQGGDAEKVAAQLTKAAASHGTVQIGPKFYTVSELQGTGGERFKLELAGAPVKLPVDPKADKAPTVTVNATEYAHVQAGVTYIKNPEKVEFETEGGKKMARMEGEFRTGYKMPDGLTEEQQQKAVQIAAHDYGRAMGLSGQGLTDYIKDISARYPLGNFDGAVNEMVGDYRAFVQTRGRKEAYDPVKDFRAKEPVSETSVELPDDIRQEEAKKAVEQTLRPLVEARDEAMKALAEASGKLDAHLARTEGWALAQTTISGLETDIAAEKAKEKPDTKAIAELEKQMVEAKKEFAVKIAAKLKADDKDIPKSLADALTAYADNNPEIKTLLEEASKWDRSPAIIEDWAKSQSTISGLDGAIAAEKAKEKPDTKAITELEKQMAEAKKEFAVKIAAKLKADDKDIPKPLADALTAYAGNNAEIKALLEEASKWDATQVTDIGKNINDTLPVAQTAQQTLETQRDEIQTAVKYDMEKFKALTGYKASATEIAVAKKRAGADGVDTRDKVQKASDFILGKDFTLGTLAGIPGGVNATIGSVKTLASSLGFTGLMNAQERLAFMKSVSDSLKGFLPAKYKRESAKRTELGMEKMKHEKATPKEGTPGATLAAGNNVGKSMLEKREKPADGNNPSLSAGNTVNKNGQMARQIASGVRGNYKV